MFCYKLYCDCNLMSEIKTDLQLTKDFIFVNYFGEKHRVVCFEIELTDLSYVKVVLEKIDLFEHMK